MAQTKYFNIGFAQYRFHFISFSIFRKKKLKMQFDYNLFELDPFEFNYQLCEPFFKMYFPFLKFLLLKVTP